MVQDLVADDACHLKALLAGDRVHNQVAMDANEVLRVEDAVLILVHNIPVSNVLAVTLQALCNPAMPIGSASAAWVGWGEDLAMLRGERKLVYLAGGIDDLRGKVLVLVANHLAEGVLNGRVVAVDKVAVDKLHRETRLACPCLSATAPMACDAGTINAQTLTHGSAADNGHLSLLGGRHCGAGFLCRACGGGATRQCWSLVVSVDR